METKQGIGWGGHSIQFNSSSAYHCIELHRIGLNCKYWGRDGKEEMVKKYGLENVRFGLYRLVPWEKYHKVPTSHRHKNTKMRAIAPLPRLRISPGQYNDSETMYARQQTQFHSDIYLQDILQTAISNAIQSSSIAMDGFDPLPERKHDKKSQCSAPEEARRNPY